MNSPNSRFDEQPKLDFSVHQAEVESYIRRNFPVKFWAPDDPADVMQYVFHEATARLVEVAAMEHKSQLKWMLTVARNRMIFLVRRYHRSPIQCDVHDSKDQSGSLTSMLEQVAIYERTPSASAASHEEHALVRQSMSRISETHAAALEMRFFEGLSTKEMSARLQKSENAVLLAIGRALKALRGEMRSTCPLT